MSGVPTTTPAFAADAADGRRTFSPGRVESWTSNSGWQIPHSDSAFLFEHAVFVAHQPCPDVLGRLGRAFEQLRMAEKALVLVERMFLTPESVFVLQFRMTLPATVFVSTVLAAPESSFVAQTCITDEAHLLGRTMCGARRSIDLRRAYRLYGLRVARGLLAGRRAGRKQEQNCHDARK